MVVPATSSTLLLRLVMALPVWPLVLKKLEFLMLTLAALSTSTSAVKSQSNG
jgi:hypothetical protein